MKIYTKQNHVEGVIRQVRKFWLTTSGILLWKVYGLLKFIWDKSYTSFKEPTPSSWAVTQFPGFFAILKAIGDSFSFISEGSSYNIFGSLEEMLSVL